MPAVAARPTVSRACSNTPVRTAAAQPPVISHLARLASLISQATGALGQLDPAHCAEPMQCCIQPCLMLMLLTVTLDQLQLVAAAQHAAHLFLMDLPHTRHGLSGQGI